MSKNLSPSLLDAHQITKRVYDEDNDAVRVEVASGTSFAISVDAADGDNLLIQGTEDGTLDGTPHVVKVNAQGELVISADVSIDNVLMKGTEDGTDSGTEHVAKINGNKELVVNVAASAIIDTVTLASDADNMGASFDSDSIDMSQMSGASFDIDFTTSDSVGTFILQGAVDTSTFRDIDLGESMNAAGVNDYFTIDLLGTSYKKLRIRYTRTSGTGTATIKAFARK